MLTALSADGQSFSPTGTAKPINSFAKYNGDIYAGGGFNGGHLQRWNGTDWDSVDLASPLMGFVSSPTVSALADYNGSLYLGGHFISSGGGAFEYNIRKWDGVSWSALGTGIGDIGSNNSSSVYALAIYNGELYVGGKFNKADGVPQANIAKWNGTSWSSVDGGLGGGSAYVKCLVVHNGELYAGGVFSVAGTASLPVSNIAKWNGTSWTALGAGMNNPVYALAVHNGELYAGGCFDSAGTAAANHIAKWDGASWSALGTGITGATYTVVNNLASYNGMLYVSGSFTAAGGQAVPGFARWDGASWSEVGAGTNGSVVAFLQDNSKLFMGGGFTMAGGLPVSNVARLVPCTAGPAQTAPISGPTAPCVSTTGVYSVLHVPGEVYSYSWGLPSGWTGSSSGNNIAVTVGPAAGNITVTPSNACGTGATMSLAVSPPNLIPLVITQTGSTLVAPAGLVSYQWYSSNGPIVGATAQTYVVLQDGSYYLRGTETNGCVTQSNTISILLGIGSSIEALTGIQLYPNPNNGVFSIKGSALSGGEHLQFEVRDVTGRLIESGNIKPENNSFSKQITLGNVVPGLYLLRISSANGCSSYPFVVK
jgi:hypothetical protein